MRDKKILAFTSIVVFLCCAGFLGAQRPSVQLSDEQKILQVMHSISSQDLYYYVAELTSEKYAGRLTGTEGYNLSADWVASHFEKWGIKPAGDHDTFLQAFPNPYTCLLYTSPSPRD